MHLIKAAQNSFHCLNRTNENRKTEKQIDLSKLGKESPQSLSASLALTQIQTHLQKVPVDITRWGFPYFC